MPSTLYGPPAIEQQDEISVDPQRGMVRTRYIRGRRADVEAFLTLNDLTDFPYSITPGEGGLCEASVQLGGADPADPDTPISIEWTFAANNMNMSLWEHPNVRDDIA